MTPADVVFHLVPRFSMISLYGALEPLRVANRFAERKFSWRFISADGKPVSASNDIPVSVSGSLADVGRPTMVVVCASYEPEQGITKPALAAMRKLAAQKVLLAGIDTGPFILGKCRRAGWLPRHLPLGKPPRFSRKFSACPNHAIAFRG